jgi:putative RNA 2'-phosphotransferase
MEKNGWVNISELIDNANKYKNMHLTIDLIKTVVYTNDKQRFIISSDKKKIRAKEGHSIEVDLDLESKKPPNVLYHGTASFFLDSIMENGLNPIAKIQDVYLSPTKKIAIEVGKRDGEPVVLYINAKDMYEDGYKFYLSENKVWLVDKVPLKYIKYEYEPISKKINSSIKDFYNLMNLIEKSWTNKKYHLEWKEAGFNIYDKYNELQAWIGIKEKKDSLMFIIIYPSDLYERAQSYSKGKGIMEILGFDEDLWIYSKLKIVDILKGKSFEKQREIVKRWINDNNIINVL